MAERNPVTSRGWYLIALTGLLPALAACGESPTGPIDCSQITVAPARIAVGATGSTIATSVSAPGGCAWTATASPAAMIAITGGASGTGSRTVTAQVSANRDGFGRTGTISVGPAVVSVDQAGDVPGPGCTFELRPPGRAMTAAGNTGPSFTGFPIEVVTSCPWTFESRTPWFRLTPLDAAGVSAGRRPDGFGNGTLLGQVDPNPLATPRTGTALIAGLVFTVVQDGTGQAACAYTVTPDRSRVPAGGGSGTFRIETGPHCSWDVDQDSRGEDFLLVSPSRGAGPSDVTYTARPNTTGAPRSGGLVVFGHSGDAQLVHEVDQD